MAVEIYSPRCGLADGFVYIEVGSLCMLLFFFLGKGFHCRCDCPLQCGRQSLQVGTEVDYTHRKVLQSLLLMAVVLLLLARLLCNVTSTQTRQEAVSIAFKTMTILSEVTQT